MIPPAPATGAPTCNIWEGLALSEPHQTNMTPEEIEDLFERSDGVVLPDAAGDSAGDDGEATLTEEEKQHRIAHLRAVLLEAHNAWVSGSESLDRIAEKLGDGSRHRESHSPPQGLSMLQQPDPVPTNLSTTLTLARGNRRPLTSFIQRSGGRRLVHQVS